jgi:hypothetical protein
VAQHARAAWRKAERYFAEAVQTEGVVSRVAMALAVFRPDGKLHDRAWAQAQLQEATKPLTGPEWGKVRRLLSDERTLYYLDWLHAQLAEAVEDPLWPEWPSAYARVQDKLSQVVRASSAVECLHSVMRMHQARHRHVSQGMLDLKRL